MSGWDRRQVLATVPVVLGGGVAGCLSGPSFPDADVIAGEDNENVFAPTELTVEVGESVTWGFASAGHDVSGRPADSDDASLPAEADPFASYGPDESPAESLVPRGETYAHTFEVPGQYEYVCIPHASLGMAGTVRVE